MASDNDMKPGSKLTEYQKRIAATENVILCVAQAEKMVDEIGLSLLITDGADPEPRQDADEESDVM